MDFSFASTSVPFFNECVNMSYQTPFYDAEIDASWSQNIDPQLRDRRQTLYQSWHNHQQPLQRFLNTPEPPLYAATSFQTYPQALSQGVNRPTAALPYANHKRMNSPAPSQDLTSSCCSARSPRPEVEDRFPDLSYYSPQSQHHDFLPSSAALTNQGFDVWGSHQSCPTSDHVKLSQVQSFADPQELFLQSDEGYIDNFSDVKVDFSQDSQGHLHVHESKEAVSPHGYHYASDEGLGASIKDASSPGESSVSHSSDLDADGEADDDDAYIAPEPELEQEDAGASDEDDEYKPSSVRTRKRRASYPAARTSSQPTKRARVAKSTLKSRKLPSKHRNITSCPSCSRADFKDSTTLQKHVDTCQVRPYGCVFSFAGCRSTFASKNEWKRHVSTQHLNLTSYICMHGQCAKAVRAGPNGGHGSEFNRKDLFTQHARRMHVPVEGKSGCRDEKEWEETLKIWQEQCLNVRRVPPTRLACPVANCSSNFEGKTAWDNRMEHVGKHLARAAGKGGEEVRQGDDHLLVSWALREGIVVRTASGGYRFPRESEVTRGGIDVDAEGEDE